MKKQWYVKLFENYAERYDQEAFTEGTKGECDFIERELNYDKSRRIIDIGCGTGRHTIELAKRGYSVTGIDLSEAQLRRAREKAEMENVVVEFLRHDARKLPFAGEFDVAIMLCDGAFPLMETDEMNFEILESATKALKSPGKLIFTSLNGLYPLFRLVSSSREPGATQEDVDEPRSQFDLMTMRERYVMTYIDDDGREQQVEANERYYLPCEITWLLKSLGYKKIDILGATLGAFSREEELTPEHFEMLVVAEK